MDDRIRKGATSATVIVKILNMCFFILNLRYRCVSLWKRINNIMGVSWDGFPNSRFTLCVIDDSDPEQFVLVISEMTASMARLLLSCGIRQLHALALMCTQLMPKAAGGCMAPEMLRGAGHVLALVATSC
ncbi:hypothetical protein NE237_002386 [Protea cynaroides]|uniref:Uncharacterized protein n=1 Tax=Protea cynaroides TaxID=273540 RepID=A0A9Q0QZF0_9MAGN|nr:hypothetical protein NE237_002386 [Protea cynaroides]